MRISALILGYALLAWRSEQVNAAALRNLHATHAPTFAPTNDTGVIYDLGNVSVIYDTGNNVSVSLTEESMEPSTAPSLLPSESPSITPSTAVPSTTPSTQPSLTPSTQPSSSPTNQPSSAPSLAPVAPVPPNDVCATAQGPLPVTLPVTEGTYPATFTAGTTDGATEQAMDRCGVGITGPGVWYTVVGTGSRLTLSTCSPNTELDTKLSVFAGSSGCNNLVCIHGNDDGTKTSGRYCDVHPWASAMYFESELGQTYYILVHGFANRVGAFELSVEGHNDSVEYAMQLSVGDKVEGDTLSAQFNLYNLLSNECGYTDSEFYGQYYDGPEDRVPRGLWYTIEGTGGRLQAQVCVPGTRLHVFAGTPQNCIGGDTWTRDCSTFAWDSSPGVTYYVLVHSLFRVLLPYDQYEDDRYTNPAFWNEDTIPNFNKPFELEITGGSSVATISRAAAGGDLFD